MYCPRCGQQQVSDEMKFCSRCGLPISGLTEWLAGGGVPARREKETQASLRSPRRKGIRRGAKLMFLSGVLFPVFLGLSLIIEEPGPMILPVTLFFVAVVIMLYSRLFGEDIPPVKNHAAQTSALGGMPEANLLPPPSNIGMYGVGGQQVRTGELAQRPSVTEHTTKLLDQE
jgi:zinc-ribbon domain